MPVHRQKKDTTTTPPGSMQEQTVPPLPDQQTFQQYLRELARGAIRVVLEAVMREELDALIGVGWGESSRQQQRLHDGDQLSDHCLGDYAGYSFAYNFGVSVVNGERFC